jgi:hypothetical protein
LKLFSKLTRALIRTSVLVPCRMLLGGPTVGPHTPSPHPSPRIAMHGASLWHCRHTQQRLATIAQTHARASEHEAPGAVRGPRKAAFQPSSDARPALNTPALNLVTNSVHLGVIGSLGHGEQLCAGRTPKKPGHRWLVPTSPSTGLPSQLAGPAPSARAAIAGAFAREAPCPLGADRPARGPRRRRSLAAQARERGQLGRVWQDKCGRVARQQTCRPTAGAPPKGGNPGEPPA